MLYQQIYSRGLPLLWLCLMACSEASNLNGLVFRGKGEKDPAALLSLSEVLMDRGDYEGARVAAEKAHRLAPDCSVCAVQLSYSYLGIAGLDLFQLARKMIEKSSVSADAVPSHLLEASNAAGQLASLASLIGLAPSDYDAITLAGNRLGELEGAPSAGAFRELPVLLPKSATDARQSDSASIQNIANAVAVLCPFMPDEVKLLGAIGDIRHNDEACTSQEAHGAKQSKALFIWAIAHLVEAIAFHQVVLYQPDGSVPNLQKRTTLIGDRSIITSLTEYVKAVRDLSAVIDIILPTEVQASRASMLTAMFNDLTTVSLAFQQMPSVPAEVAQDIVTAIGELQGQKDQLKTDDQNKDQRSVAFKDQLTEKMATELRVQISTRINAGQVSEAEHTELCQAYRTISTAEFSSCTGF